MKNFQNMTPDDYIRMLRYRIWYFLAAVLAVGTAGTVYAWRMPSIYRSEMTIQLGNRLLPEEYIGTLVRESVPERIDALRQQLQLRRFIEDVDNRLDLRSKGASSSAVDFLPAPPNSFKLAFEATDAQLAQTVVQTVGEHLLLLNASSRRETVTDAGEFLEAKVKEAAIGLEQAQNRLLAFNQQQFGGLNNQVDVNALSDLQSEMQTMEVNVLELERQQASAQRRLREQRDLRLAATPPPTQLTPPPDPVVNETKPVPPLITTPLEKDLAAKRAELSRVTPANPNYGRLRREVEALESQIAEFYEAQRALMSPPETAKPANQTAPVLVPLPGMDMTIDLAEAEINEEIEMLKSKIETTRRAKDSLGRRIDDYQRRLNLAPAVRQAMNTLEREVAIARERHELWLKQQLASETAGKVDADTSSAPLKIIDPPRLPLSPSGPNRPLIAAMGWVAAFLAGAGLVFVREYTDTTLRDEEEAATLLGLPVLTSVPIIAGAPKERSGGRPRTLSIAGPATSKYGVPEHSDSAFAGLQPTTFFTLDSMDSRVRSIVVDRQTLAGEQYRLLRTSLSLMRDNRKKMQTVLITSTVPGEGKTFTAACLSAVLAQEAGKRVLLIDADLRTASVSRLLGFGSEARGLSQILRGEISVQNSVSKCSNLNLYFLPAGGPVSNPTELLSSPLFQKTLREYEAIFDWIVIDSVPLLALADGNIILSNSDAALLVVRSGKAPAKLIKLAIARIPKERLCGVLMNGVRQLNPARYYGNYYAREKAK